MSSLTSVTGFAEDVKSAMGVLQQLGGSPIPREQEYVTVISETASAGLIGTAIVTYTRIVCI